METLFWLCIGALLSWLLVLLGVLIYFGMKLCVFFTHTISQWLYCANCKHTKHIYDPIKNTFAANQTNTEKTDP